MEEDSLKLLSEDPAIAKWGTIINGGTCATNMGAAVRFGAMGTAAVLGNQFALSLYDPEGNFIESKEFTIVGVLNDQRDAYYNVIRTMAYMGADIEKIDFPQMFVYRDEIPDKSRLTAMILCSPDIGQYDVAKSLKSKGLKVCDGTRLTELSGIATVEYETQEELYSKAHAKNPVLERNVFLLCRSSSGLWDGSSFLCFLYMACEYHRRCTYLQCFSCASHCESGQLKSLFLSVVFKHCFFCGSYSYSPHKREPFVP